MSTVWFDTLLLRALLLEELRTSTCLAWKCAVFSFEPGRIPCHWLFNTSKAKQQNLGLILETCVKTFFDLPKNQSISQPRWKCLNYQGSTVVCSVFITSCAQASVYMGETHLIHACNTSFVLWATLFKVVLSSPWVSSGTSSVKRPHPL